MIDKNLETKYSAGYADVPKREDDDPRTYQAIDILLPLMRPGMKVIDAGIGDGHKTLPLASLCHTFYGIDTSVELLEKARDNASELGLGNVLLAECKAQKLPHMNDSIDMVISLLAPHDVYEAYRVLRPGGMIYIEKVGEQDKRELKMLFGSDKEGPRGYLCNMGMGERLTIIEKELKAAGFDKIRTASTHFNCYYPTIDDLTFMLKEVSHTVRDFDQEKDKEALYEAQKKFSTPRGIRVRKHEIMLAAEKPEE